MVRRAVRSLPRLALACLLLALAGCAAHQHAGLADDLPAAAAAAGGGLAEVRHRHDEVRIALFIAGCIAIAVVVIADLCILPFSHRRRHLWFPCCRAVIRVCL